MSLEHHKRVVGAGGARGDLTMPSELPSTTKSAGHRLLRLLTSATTRSGERRLHSRFVYHTHRSSHGRQVHLASDGRRSSKLHQLISVSDVAILPSTPQLGHKCLIEEELAACGRSSMISPYNGQ
nr:uncharacterized protein LOC127295740 [Lolium perenne]